MALFLRLSHSHACHLRNSPTFHLHIIPIKPAHVHGVSHAPRQKSSELPHHFPLFRFPSYINPSRPTSLFLHGTTHPFPRRASNLFVQVPLTSPSSSPSTVAFKLDPTLSGLSPFQSRTSYQTTPVCTSFPYVWVPSQLFHAALPSCTNSPCSSMLHWQHENGHHLSISTEKDVALLSSWEGRSFCPEAASPLFQKEKTSNFRL